MSLLELTEFFEDRMHSYRFLATMYQTALSAEFIEQLLAMDPHIETPLDDCIEAMRNCEPEQLRIDLAAEYNRVFLGMGPDPIAPFESVYTSPERLLMQDARDKVLALYRQESLKRASEAFIPEDHISMEFEYMAHLCEVAAQASVEDDAAKTEEYLTKQRDFLHNHLLVWVFDMCIDMEKRVKTDFYKAICSITRQQLENDREWFAQHDTSSFS